MISINKNVIYLAASFLILLALSFSSCKSKKRVVKTPTTDQPVVIIPPKPETKRDDDPTKTGTLDTAKIEVVDPIIETVDLPNSDGAKVSLMMPFLSSQYQVGSSQLPKNSDWGLAYYAGVKIGLEELENEGQACQLHVFDTEANVRQTQTIMSNGDLVSSHAIIGPYLTKNVRVAATSAKSSGIPFIVPFSASTRLVDDYAELLQFQPSLLSHLDATAEFLNKHYDPEQVVLVGLPTGEQDQEVSYLLKQQRELNPQAKSWRTWKLETADLGLQDLNWEDKFDEDRITVFVFPVYKKPKLVFSFLSQLQIGRAGMDATVFGMPQWINFNKLDPAIMEDLQIMITSGFYADKNDNRVRNFERKYFDKYGALPALSAYLGYDAIRYVVPLANQYGKDFVKHLPSDYKGLLSQYNFKPVFGQKNSISTLMLEDQKPIRRENIHIDILQYRNFNFQKMY